MFTSPFIHRAPLLCLSGALVLGLLCSGCNSEEAVLQPAISKLLKRAETLKDANQPAEALCRLQAAEDLAPNSYPVQYNLGVLLGDQQQYPAAIPHLEKALSIKPNDPSSLYTLGLTYQSLGDAYIRASQITDAKELAKPEWAGLAQGLSPDQLRLQAQTAYAKALETDKLFLEKAPDNDPSRRDVESQVQLLENPTGAQ